MTWFLIALLVAIGGIWTAYARSKGMKAADAAARERLPVAAIPPPDVQRIDINDRESLKRWATELGVDEWDLKGAIQDVGPDVETVRKRLREG